jgi:hypothetical protein
MLLVPLKVYCRKRHGGWRNVQMDDYMSIIALLLANGFFYVCIIGMCPSPCHSFFVGNDWGLTLIFARHARVTRHTHYGNHQSGANHRFPAEYLCRQCSIYLEHNEYQAIRSGFLLAALRDQVPDYHLRSHRCIHYMVYIYRTFLSLLASSLSLFSHLKCERLTTAFHSCSA